MMKQIQTSNPSLFAKYPYFFLPAVVSVGFFLTIHLALPYTVIFFIYGIIPLMDQICKKNWVNPTLRQMKELQEDWGFKAVLYIAVAFEFYVYFVAFHLLPTSTFYQLIPMTILGIHLFGVGFMLSHQLIHKGGFDKILGTLNQLKIYYAHWTVEHTIGHHKLVATPQDPASAPKGMSFWQFLPKTIFGTYRSAMKISPLSTIFYTVIYFIYFAAIWYLVGMFEAFFSLFVASGAILMLQITNYVQHYGLRRKLLPDGTYQKVTIRHSWNAPHRMSNYLLFKLQRHSDHHQNAFKPYQTLCSYEDSPMLPHGYIVCMIMATIPSVWFDIMDPLVDQYNSSDQQTGAQLKQFKKSEQKAQNFVKKLFNLTGIFAALQWIITAGFGAYSYSAMA